MKIKRFFAVDIRQAMKMVKDELGADAVIMSNRSVDGGVEIVAACDFDEQLIRQKLPDNKENNALPASEVKPASGVKPFVPSFSQQKQPLHIVSNPRKKGADGTTPPRTPRKSLDQYVGYAEKIQINRSNITKSAALDASKNLYKPDNFDHAPEILAKVPEQKQMSEIELKQEKEFTASEQANEKLIRELFQELKTLKTTMNHSLSELGWKQNNQSNPTKIEVLRRLTEMGVAKKLSSKVVNRLINIQNTEVAFKKAQDMLVSVLPIASDNLMDCGGVVMLIGPTGVGKTTTIAKLAAQFILKHGSNSVALITTDNYRIAAHDHINTYGRILNVPVRVANSAEQLRNQINEFSDKRLILIDTAGMSQRDQKLAEQLKLLQHDDLPIKSYLVMSAASQYKAMREIIDGFQIFQPESCILTKLDEAASKGAAISSLIEKRMPLAFITDGQQVPEDLHCAVARTLIDQCVAELTKDEEINSEMNYEDWVTQGYA